MAETPSLRLVMSCSILTGGVLVLATYCSTVQMTVTRGEPLTEILQRDDTLRDVQFGAELVDIEGF